MKKRVYIKGKYDRLKNHIPDYLAKKVTREELMKLCYLTKAEIRDFFRNHNVKIWDYERKRSDKNEFEKDAELYKRGEITIKEIAKKHGLAVGTVRNKLNLLGIDTGRKKSVKVSKSKYFSIKELCRENSYAQLFYEFNK